MDLNQKLDQWIVDPTDDWPDDERDWFRRWSKLRFAKVLLAIWLLIVCWLVYSVFR